MARNPSHKPEAAPETGVLDDILSRLDPATARALRDEIARLQARIADLGESVADVGRAGGAALGEGARAAADAGRARFAGTKAEVEDFARERPGQALLAAGGVGLLLGLLLARR